MATSDGSMVSNTAGAFHDEDKTKTDDSKDCEVPLLRGCRSHGGDEASRGGVRGDSRLQFVGWGH